MAQWDHGYVTDVAYTTNAYHETTPSWLAACSLLLGYRPPDLGAPFRYADLGCGNGLGAMIAAASNPRAEVWGFDFNPTHIENARALAARAGLTNVHFEEISFEALARGDTSSAGDDFDIMVAHGILSWISFENWRHLAAIIARRLRPGGLTYLSYNVASGWSGMAPIQLLMRQLAKSSQRRTDLSVAEIFQVLDQLKDSGAAFFRAHPALDARLEQMKTQDARYLAHEFLNQDWHPVMFADVADALSETKTQYIGTATLVENIDAVAVQDGVVPVLANVRDSAARETIRDLASAKSFRRDLWRKGGERLGAQEQLNLLDGMSLVWSGKVAEADITFAGPIGAVTGQVEFYRPMLDRITEGPTTFGQLRSLPALRDRQAAEFVQAAVLLIGGGFAHPAWPHGSLPETRLAARGFNAAVIDRLRIGVDLPRLVSPVIGSGINIDVMEGLALGQLLDGVAPEPEPLIDALLGDLARSGRTLRRDGQPLLDPVEGRVLLGQAVRGVLERRLPLLRIQGVLG
jgi:SAM-dependent methyltransferase